MQEKGFRAGIRDALPSAMGYVSIGLAFGVVAAGNGWTWLEIMLSSVLIYAGSAQFALVSLILAGDPLLSIALTVFLINLRNMLMSLHATTIFSQSGLLENIAIGTLMTDESYGVLMAEKIHNDQISKAWMHGNNLLGYLAWIAATVLGGLLGAIIPNPQLFGLDFALVAMFIGIFAGQVESMAILEPNTKLGLILLSVAVSFLGLTMLVSQSLAVLLATVLGCLVGVILDGK